MAPPDVGRLREQSALTPADTPILVVSKDPEIASLLKAWRVVAVYPDTTDADHEWVQGTGTFKIELAPAADNPIVDSVEMVRDLKQELLNQQRDIETMIQHLKRRRGERSESMEPTP